MTSIGVWEASAFIAPVSAFVAPGPDVTRTTARPPLIRE
jgi:hypothetical protein